MLSVFPHPSTFKGIMKLAREVGWGLDSWSGLRCPHLLLLTQETGSCPCWAGLEPTAEVFTPTLGDDFQSGGWEHSSSED